jgi:hypothetical protein
MFSLSKTLATLALLTAGAAALSAQPLDRRHLNLGIQGRYSHVLDGQEIYEKLLNSHNYGIYGATLGVSTHPDDGDWYAYAWNYPSYGFGFSLADMGSLSCRNDSHFGDVLNLYGWAEFNLVRTRSFRFGPLLELGLSYSGDIYDYYNNPSNQYFGSQLFAMIGAGLRAEWLFTPQWGIHAGVYLTHHSNGMLRTPNLGINELSGSVGVRYYFAPTRFDARPAAVPEKPEFRKGLRWTVYAAAGVHSCPTELNGIWESEDPARLAPARFRGVAGVGLDWHYSPIFATGIGLEANYAANNYRGTDLLLEGREDPRGYSPWRIGVYLSQEFRYRQVSAHIQIGVYLFKRCGLTEDIGSSFQKLGARYHFRRSRGLYIGLDMRAHQFDRSYALEWSLGFNL